MRRLGVIALGLLVVLGCRRLADHPLVVTAVEELRANPRVQDVLGGGLACDSSVRGTPNETDGIATLQFDVRGSKGSGVVVVEGKKTRGEWGVTLLELRPARGPERISLTADFEARTGTDTPRFDPSASPATPSATPAPPAEIEITLPPGPSGS